MADERRHPMKYPQERGQNDEDKSDPEQPTPRVSTSRDTSPPSSSQASATPVSNNETHTPMDWDTTNRKTRDQTDHQLTSKDVERRENRTSCQDVQPHTSGDVVGTETHTSVQSQETTFRDSENQLVETRTTTQFGEKNTIIYKTYNTGNHVHNHFHYSCSPPPHHHGDSSSSYHVPCPDCLPYHHKDHPPLAETHRPQPESEPRHLGLPHHPVPQLTSPQQTQQTESSQSRETSNSGMGAQNNNHPAKMSNPDKVLPKSPTSPSVARRDVTYQATTGQDEETLAVKSKDKPKPRGKYMQQATTGQDEETLAVKSKDKPKPRDSKPRSQETVRKTSRASDVTPKPNVTRAEQRVRQEVRTGKRADREKKENGQSQNTKTASESVETRRECSDRVSDSVCILDSEGQALEPGDAIWMGHQRGTRAIYVGNQEVVYCRATDLVVVKEELAMTDPFGKFTVYRWGECQVFTPRERVDRATAWIGKKFEEGDFWMGRTSLPGFLPGWDCSRPGRKVLGWSVRQACDRRRVTGHHYLSSRR